MQTSHVHGHDHTRDDGASEGTREIRVLRAALGITAAVLVVEAIGGFVTGSLALIADAGHMLTDAGALALALAAAWMSLRPRDARRSFGYGRTEILGALANGLLLGGVSVGVLLESIERLAEPRAIDAGPMLAIAVVGLLANLLAARLLHGSGSHSMNVRAALWHVIGDALGSIGAIGAAIALLVWDFGPADALASMGIAGLLVATAYRLVRDSVHVLLEGAPEGVDVEQVARELVEIEGVRAVHDLHIWTVSSGFAAMSCHVDLEPNVDPDDVRRAVHRLLHEVYDIRHTTIQTESAPPLLQIE